MLENNILSNLESLESHSLYFVDDADGMLSKLEKSVKSLTSENSFSLLTDENLHILKKSVEVLKNQNVSVDHLDALFDKIRSPLHESSKFNNLQDIIDAYIPLNDRNGAEYDYSEVGTLDDLIAKAMKRKKTKKPPVHNASQNFKLDSECIKAVPGLFALLRMFFLDHEMKRLRSTIDGSSKPSYLTTSQLCERVREWQANEKIQRLNAQWINKLSDWSLVVEDALHFLTGDPSLLSNHLKTPNVKSPNDSFRLPDCPRPFVEGRSRYSQWIWITVSIEKELNNSSEGDSHALDERRILTRIFPEWSRFIVKFRKSNIGKNSGDSIKDLSMPTKFSPTSLATKIAKNAKASGNRKAKIARPSNSKVKESRSEGTMDQDLSSTEDDLPAALYATTWKVRPYTRDESLRFRKQETDRFAKPWDPFVYNATGYSSIVAPLKSFLSRGYLDCLHDLESLRSYLETSRPRHHPLLRVDRPAVVGMAEIARDAVARLPNGEGSRQDIVTLASESGFLVSNFDKKQFTQCISAALDRLQAEPDSPVLFQAATRKWVYMHRDRTMNDFTRIFNQQCIVENKKRKLKRGFDNEDAGPSYNSNPFSDDQDEYYYREQGLSKMPTRGRGAPRGRKPFLTDRQRMARGRGHQDQGYRIASSLQKSFRSSDYIPDIDDLLRMDEEPSPSIKNRVAIRGGYKSSQDTLRGKSFISLNGASSNPLERRSPYSEDFDDDERNWVSERRY